MRKNDIPLCLSWILANSSFHNSAIDLSELSNIQDSVLITGEAADLISLQDASKILQNAVYTSTIATYMQSKSTNSPLFEYRFLPFMSKVSHILLSRHVTNENADQNQDADHKPVELNESGEYQANVRRLDDILGGWGMVRCEVVGDGNCCFSAIATFLLILLTLNQTSFQSMDYWKHWTYQQWQRNYKKLWCVSGG